MDKSSVGMIALLLLRLDTGCRNMCLQIPASSQFFRNHPNSRLYGRSHGLKKSYLPDENVFGANKQFLAEDTVSKTVQHALADPAEGKAALRQHQPGRELPAVDVERSAPDVGSGVGFGIDSTGQARPSRGQPWSVSIRNSTSQNVSDKSS